MRGMRGEQPVRTLIGIGILAFPVIALLMALVFVRQFTALAAPDNLSITANTANGGGLTVAPLATASYTYEIENTGTATETVTINADTEDSWLTSVSPTGAIVVGPNSTATISVTVTVDGNTTNGDKAVTTVELLNGGILIGSVTNETTVQASYGFDLSADDKNREGLAGETITFKLTIDSLGTLQDQVTIRVDDTDSYTTKILTTSDVRVDQDTRTLPASGSNGVIEVDVVVDIPAGAAVDDTNKSTIVVESQGNTIFEEDIKLDIVVEAPAAATATNTPIPVATSDGSIYADDREPNNDRTDAAAFDPSLTQICQQTFWPIGDVDYYSFVAEAGKEYTIQTTVTAGLDPVMSIINPQGNEIASSDNFEGSVNSQIVFVPQQNGTFLIQLSNKGTVDPTNLVYCIDVASVIPTETPTPTITQTPTETPTQTPTPTPDGDSCEPNETLDTACLIALDTDYANDFVPGYGTGTDRDYFRTWVKPNVRHNCRVSLPDGSVADTTVTIYDQSGGWLGFNDDRAPDDNGSEVFFVPNYQGYAYVLVEPLNAPVDLRRSDTVEKLYAYTLRCEATPPTSTPLPSATPTKTETPIPSSTPEPTATGTPITPSALTNDDCEPNENTGQACLLPTGLAIGANFRPPFGAGNDRDYFRVNVKPGIEYTCETRNLTRSADTKITIFNQNGQQIGFNDDRPIADDQTEPDFSSFATVNPGYQGEMFVLVESSIFIRPEDAEQYGYEVLCQSVLIPTSTPWPTRTPWPSPTPGAAGDSEQKATTAPTNGNATTAPAGNGNATAVPATRVPATSAPVNSNPVVVNTPLPTSTPAPPPTLVPTATPFTLPSPTPVPSINIVPLPTATPPLIPTPQVQLAVKVYYDENNSYSAELTEGIKDIAVSVYDNASGTLLGFGNTNEAGEVFFGGNPPLPTSGAIRLMIPYLNYEQIVPADVTRVDIRIPAQRLPGQIP